MLGRGGNNKIEIQAEFDTDLPRKHFVTVRTGNTFNPAVLRLAEVDVTDMRTEEKAISNIARFIGRINIKETTVHI